MRKRGLVHLRQGCSLLMSLVLLAGLAGCAQSAGAGATNGQTENSAQAKAAISVTGSNYPLTVKDFTGTETMLDQKPQRVAVLSGTPLNIWYDLGGKSVCSSTITDNLKLIPEYKNEIMKLPQVGAVYAVNMEAVIAQKPDLIIAQEGTQSTQADKLRAMGYKVITTQVRSFEDVLDTYRVFGKILGADAQAAQKVKALEQTKDDIVAKLPQGKKSVVILYVTAKTLSVKLDNSIAGEMAQMLKLKNIASDLPPDTIGSETTPLDIEYIVEKNPDYVLVTSMVTDNQEAKKSVEKEFQDNPAWKGVKAVQEGKIIYLPQQYFLYNAGPYYDEGLEYMAQSIYPQIYGEVKDN